MDNNADVVMGNTDNQAWNSTQVPQQHAHSLESNPIKDWLIHFLTTNSNILESIRAKDLSRADELLEMAHRSRLVADLIQILTNCEGLAMRLQLHQDAHFYRCKKHELENTHAELNMAMVVIPPTGWKGGRILDRVVAEPSQAEALAAVVSKPTRTQDRRDERERRGRKQRYRRSQGGSRRGNTLADPATQITRH